jgi:hypothetical protein
MLYCHVISAFREKGGIPFAGFVLAFSCVQVLLAFHFSFSTRKRCRQWATFIGGKLSFQRDRTRFRVSARSSKEVCSSRLTREHAGGGPIQPLWEEAPPGWFDRLEYHSIDSGREHKSGFGSSHWRFHQLEYRFSAEYLSLRATA